MDELALQDALHIYSDNVGGARNSLTGKRFNGSPIWLEPAFADGTSMRSHFIRKTRGHAVISFKSRHCRILQHRDPPA